MFGQQAQAREPFVGAPGQAVMVAVPMAAGMANGFDHIGSLAGLQVKEKVNWLQELSADMGVEFQQANKYSVLDQGGVHQIFYAHETTGCCTRQLQTGCCHDCAPYSVKIHYTAGGFADTRFVSMERPFQLTCCCLNRPVANVTNDITGQTIGSFRDPCTCFGLRFQIRDAQEVDRLLVDGGCCCGQPGMWCPLPCGPCSEVKFDIKDTESGNLVGHVTKQVPGCLTWCCAPDVQNYQLEFGQVVANPEWKALLLAFTIFMDFRYFNVNTNQQNAAAANNQ